MSLFKSNPGNYRTRILDSMAPALVNVTDLALRESREGEWKDTAHEERSSEEVTGKNRLR